MSSLALALHAVQSTAPHAKAEKWAFTVTYTDGHGFTHWSVTSPPRYTSKGEALYWAYAECQKHGYTPAARGISISTRKQ
jgi:hypothetical protein